MGVIVTRGTGTGSAGGSGTGAYTIPEKLAIEMEMEFKAAQADYYKELLYEIGGVNDGTLISAGIWIDTIKTTRLFSKDFTYEVGGGGRYGNLTQTLLLRESDGAQLLKLFGYDGDDNLTSIQVSAG
jgi:hypothetical protein